MTATTAHHGKTLNAALDFYYRFEAKGFPENEKQAIAFLADHSDGQHGSHTLKDLAEGFPLVQRDIDTGITLNLLETKNGDYTYTDFGKQVFELI